MITSIYWEFSITPVSFFHLLLIASLTVLILQMKHAKKLSKLTQIN